MRAPAALISKILGREIKAEKRALGALGRITDPIESMCDRYDHHGLPGNPLTLRAILERDHAHSTPTLKSSPQRLDMRAASRRHPRLVYAITKTIIRSSVGASGQQAQSEHGSITSKLSARAYV